MIKLLKVRDIAELLGICDGSVYEMVAKGRIPCIRIGSRGRTIRFDPEQIEEYVKQLKAVKEHGTHTKTR